MPYGWKKIRLGRILHCLISSIILTIIINIAKYIICAIVLLDESKFFPSWEYFFRFCTWLDNPTLVRVKLTLTIDTNHTKFINLHHLIFNDICQYLLTCFRMTLNYTNWFFSSNQNGRKRNHRSQEVRGFYKAPFLPYRNAHSRSEVT